MEPVFGEHGGQHQQNHDLLDNNSQHQSFDTISPEAIQQYINLGCSSDDFGQEMDSTQFITNPGLINNQNAIESHGLNLSLQIPQQPQTIDPKVFDLSASSSHYSPQTFHQPQVESQNNNNLSNFGHFNFDTINDQDLGLSLDSNYIIQQSTEQQIAQSPHFTIDSARHLSVDDLNSLHPHTPTPPHLSSNTAYSSRNSSPGHSPSPSQLIQFQKNQQLHQNRLRTPSESLDPSSAAFPSGFVNNGGLQNNTLGSGLEWGIGAAFRQHRRAVSDAPSDISSCSQSNQASPFLENNLGFDTSAPLSPLLDNTTEASLFGNSIDFNNFNINDTNAATAFSPTHSIVGSRSPQLSVTQQPLPSFIDNHNNTNDISTSFNVDNTFGLNDISSQLGLNTTNHGMEHHSLPNLNVLHHQNSFPTLTPTISLDQDVNHVDLMTPPEINIDFAPSPSRQQSLHQRQRAASHNALIPPEAFRRRRAKSDPFSSARLVIPHHNNLRSTSPSAHSDCSDNDSLSPIRHTRPRSISTSSDSRQYLLDLADPERIATGTNNITNSNHVETKKKKNVANYQCHLCDKKFTRPYNLRSHLRTHTDERPFVCSICGKAFARQHDRKRHEGLHTGEKKFVCKGNLKIGQSWGCGRKFARADALGRHFRSEAGRECIKPLLNEEAQERRLQSQLNAQNLQNNNIINNGNNQDNNMMMDVNPQSTINHQSWYGNNNINTPTFNRTESTNTDTSLDINSTAVFQLPAALLEMYPDLATFDYNSLSRTTSATTATGNDFLGGFDENKSDFDSALSCGDYGDYDLSDNDHSIYGEDMDADDNHSQIDANHSLQTGSINVNASNWP